MLLNYRSLDCNTAQANQDNSNRTKTCSIPINAPALSNRSPCMVTAPISAPISSIDTQQISSRPSGICVSQRTQAPVSVQAAVSVQAPVPKSLKSTNQTQLHFIATPPAPKTITSTTPNMAAFYVQPPGLKNLKNSSQNGFFQSCIYSVRIVINSNFLKN